MLTTTELCIHCVTEAKQPHIHYFYATTSTAWAELMHKLLSTKLNPCVHNALTTVLSPPPSC